VKKLLLAGTTVLLMATSASAQSSLPPQLSAATDFAHTAIQARKHASGTRCLLNVCNA
jgi:hypothetical protein